MTEQLSKWNTNQKILAAIAIVLITVSSSVGISFWISGIASTDTNGPGDHQNDDVSSQQYEWPKAAAGNFSSYTDYESEFEIDAPQYEIELNEGVSNILNLEDFRRLEGWSSEVEDLIEENYFAAVQNCNYSLVNPNRPYRLFSEVYDDNYWGYTPSFVTADSMYHVFHVLYDYALRTMEKDNLTAYVELLVDHLLDNSVEIYRKMELNPKPSTLWWKDVAKRNIAFLSVAKKCLNPDWSPIPEVADWVEATIALIEEANGYDRNWFMNQLEDFSQYKPRGHYAGKEELERFFKAMMFLGRMNFRLHPADNWRTAQENDEKGLRETAQAILMCYALNDSSSVLGPREGILLWKSIYLPTAFFVGESDDLTPLEYLDCMQEIYGPDYELQDIQDKSVLENFRSAAEELRNPRILADFMLGTEDMENATKGMSIMGQRYIPDSYIFWQLVYPNVLYRFLPKGLDVMSALGSERAKELLASETAYEYYTEQMNMLRNEFGNISDNQWIQNLYWLWLYSMKPLLHQSGNKTPSFMQSKEWTDKKLLTALGTWTELRHDTTLYAKQSSTGYISSVYPPSGYVEPVPKVYARLASLSKMLLDGLTERCLISSELNEKLSHLHRLLLRLKTISEKELASQPLNETEETTIRVIGNALRSLERIGDEKDTDRAALIADVHTDPNDEIALEVATGNPMVLFVAVPTPNGSVYLARGAIYSYHEFAVPMNQRMTDEEWWELVDSSDCPDMPNWVQSFVSGAEATALNLQYSDPVVICQGSNCGDGSSNLRQVQQLSLLLVNIPRVRLVQWFGYHKRDSRMPRTRRC